VIIESKKTAIQRFFDVRREGEQGHHMLSEISDFVWWPSETFEGRLCGAIVSSKAQVGRAVDQSSGSSLRGYRP